MRLLEAMTISRTPAITRSALIAFSERAAASPTAGEARSSRSELMKGFPSLVDDWNFDRLSCIRQNGNLSLGAVGPTERLSDRPVAREPRTSSHWGWRKSQPKNQL